MSPRTIVVGAGVIGLATAASLAERGARVTLVDRGDPGAGTSSTTFSWLNANSKVPRAYQELNVAGVDAYRRLAAEDATGTAPWLRLNGRIEWAETAEQVERMDAAIAAMRAWDYPVETITVAEATRLEPDLRIPPGAEVRFFPSEGFLIPPRYLPWLLARAAARGVELRTGGAVSAFRIGGDGAVTGVELDDGASLGAERVVVCAGRWTKEVLGLVGASVPMIPRARGSPAMGFLGYTTPVATRLARTVSGPGLSIRADAPEGRYVLQPHGLDDLADPALTPGPDEEIGREILARAARVLARFEGAGLAELRVGQRAIPADRVTVAGWVPEVEGLYAIATHSGYTLALHLAGLAASEVVDGAIAGELADFRPSRFAAPVDAAAVAGRPIH
jgi:glycine/D-amino acid oxidase-like deaminating enzyme